MCSGNLFGILSDIYCGILSDIHSSIPFDIYSDILSDRLSESGILSDIYSNILAGIYAGILFGIFWHSGMFCDVCLVLTGMFSDIPGRTAQSGGKVSKIGNLWKPIGEVPCCEPWMGEQIRWWIERWLKRRPIYLSICVSICLSNLV